MKKANKVIAALLLCALLLVAASAQQPVNIKLDFKETVLKNGLRVLTAEIHSAPVVSVVVTYDVGARNEPKGHTGLAHLFENMMFEGSEKAGRREQTVTLSNLGGFAVGTTNADRTYYFNGLPSNQLELGLFFEADRMRSLLSKNGLRSEMRREFPSASRETASSFSQRASGPPTEITRSAS